MTDSLDRRRIAAAVEELLLAIGADPESAELRGTPSRVADAYAEFFSGMGRDPLEPLQKTLPVEADTGDLVLMRDIALRSVCEHHLLPFRGTAHIAYRPAERIVGLSALPRVVDILASRPQLQERLGEQIAHAIDTGLAPEGVLVVLEASHGCVTDRGVMQAAASVVTVAARGSLTEPSAQAPVLALLGQAGQPGGVA